MRDHDVRQAVRRELRELHAGDHDTRIIEEMGIWAATSRIDIAVVNGELCGFELKSAKDDLRRLPSQESIYSQVFDRVTVVAAEDHLNGCLRVVPAWWGFTIATMQGGSVRLHEHRRSELNPSHEPIFVARLLWRDEALSILESRNLARGFRSKSVAIIQERLAEVVPLDELRHDVRKILKSRVYGS